MPPQTEAVELKLPSGQLPISGLDMAAIKQELHSALLQRAGENPTDYRPLVAELEAAAIWFEGGVANIGPWELKARNDQIVLVRRSPPSPTRLFHVAILQRSASASWRLVRMDVEVVHGL